MRDFSFSNRTALVTGAASGIGRALALGLAQRGCRLALIDRDEAGLEETVRRVQRVDGASTVWISTVDLSMPADFTDLAAQVEARVGRAGLVINNAGVALAGTVADFSLDDLDWLMNVNFRSVVAMTKAFLPQLLAEQGTHLVNVSSLFGLAAPAGQSAYAASKYAVRGFTEAIRGELEPRGIGVTLVHPGGVATNIAMNARVGNVAIDEAERQRAQIQRLLTMPPEEAAEAILQAVRKRRPRLVLTAQAKSADRLVRLLPAAYVPILNRRLARPSHHR